MTCSQATHSPHQGSALDQSTDHQESGKPEHVERLVEALEGAEEARRRGHQAHFAGDPVVHRQDPEQIRRHHPSFAIGDCDRDVKAVMTGRRVRSNVGTVVDCGGPVGPGFGDDVAEEHCVAGRTDVVIDRHVVPGAPHHADAGAFKRAGVPTMLY